jgi:hypothetical protein
LNFIKILLSLIFLSFNIIWVYGQRSISGKVIEENLETLPEVRIYNKDTVLIAQTSLEGYFELTVPKETNKLLFGFIGYELAAVSLPDNCEYLEVILLVDVLYHHISNRKIDRLREKEFNKLPLLHQKAFDKGIFKFNEPCYHREFEPIKKQLDEIGSQTKAKTKTVKKNFKEVAIGDTIRIPYSGSYGSDGTDRTTLSVFSFVVDGTSFDCIIEGVIVGKNTLKNGYNIVYKVTNTKQCKYEPIIIDNKNVVAGEIFSHNMKYFKVLDR